MTTTPSIYPPRYDNMTVHQFYAALAMQAMLGKDYKPSFSWNLPIARLLADKASTMADAMMEKFNGEV